MRREQTALDARTHSLCALRNVSSLQGNLCRIPGKNCPLSNCSQMELLGGVLLKTRISHGERDERQLPGRRMKTGRGVTVEDGLGSTAVPGSLQRVLRCGVGLGTSMPGAPRAVPDGSWLSSAACSHLHRRFYFSLHAFVTCSFLRCEGTDYTSLTLYFTYFT